MTATQTRKFNPGQIVATPGAMEALQKNGVPASWFVARHLRGDWGVLPKSDVKANEDAIAGTDPENWARVLSSYPLNDGTKIWIITEADRGVTTLLLPDEY